MMNYDVDVEFELKVWGRNKETNELEFGSTDMYLPTQWSAVSLTLCFIWHVHLCVTLLFARPFTPNNMVNVFN